MSASYGERNYYVNDELLQQVVEANERLRAEGRPAHIREALCRDLIAARYALRVLADQDHWTSLPGVKIWNARRDPAVTDSPTGIALKGLDSGRDIEWDT
jgi:hypothetical protein